MRPQTRFIRGVLLMAMLFVAAPAAQAFFDPPWVTPEQPMAGEPVFVNIRGGICDSIFERPGYPQISIQDSSIRIVEYGHHWDFEDFCVYQVGTLVREIGSFPPGDYSLTVDFTYNDFLPAPVVVTLGVVPFTVTGAAAPAPVPAYSGFSLSLLVLIVFAAACAKILFHDARTGRLRPPMRILRSFSALRSRSGSLPSPRLS